MSESHGDVNKIKFQEASSPSKKITRGLRKQIAGKLIGTLALLSTIGIQGDTLNQNPDYSSWVNNLEAVQSLSVQDLEKRVEGIYNIRILSGENLWLATDSGKAVETKSEWTKTQLLDLMTSLDKLPRHFSLPDFDLLMHNPVFVPTKSSVPVSFAMVNEIPSDDSNFTVLGKCYCGIRDKKSEVVFTKSAFENSGYDLKIVHELTHRVITPGDFQFVLDLLEVSSDTTFTELLKENLTKTQSSLLGLVLEAQDMKGHDGFYAVAVTDRFFYGATNPNEFVAVASEFYVQGKEVFLKDYSLLIGQKKAEKFYDHMRDNVFRGKEYKGK